MQYGYQGTIVNNRNGFLDPENVGIDTNIINLCCLVEEVVHFNGSHFEIQNGGCLNESP